ncbi:MAG: hypothetical protein ABEK01_00565 [Candidatus Nanohaloarchaea archaeon]
MADTTARNIAYDRLGMFDDAEGGNVYRRLQRSLKHDLSSVKMDLEFGGPRFEDLDGKDEYERAEFFEERGRESARDSYLSVPRDGFLEEMKDRIDVIRGKKEPKRKRLDDGEKDAFPLSPGGLYMGAEIASDRYSTSGDASSFIGGFINGSIQHSSRMVDTEEEFDTYVLPGNDWKMIGRDLSTDIIVDGDAGKYAGSGLENDGRVLVNGKVEKPAVDSDGTVYAVRVEEFDPGEVGDGAVYEWDGGRFRKDRVYGNFIDGEMDRENWRRLD